MGNKLDRGSLSLRQYKRIKTREQPSLREIKVIRDTVTKEAGSPVDLLLKLVDEVPKPARIKVRFEIVRHFYCFYNNLRASNDNKTVYKKDMKFKAKHF